MNTDPYAHLDTYRKQAQLTRNRRQYPTPAQKEAAKRSTMRDGDRNMTKEDLLLMSQHPDYPVFQRAEYKQRYEQAVAVAA